MGMKTRERLILYTTLSFLFLGGLAAYSFYYLVDSIFGRKKT